MTSKTKAARLTASKLRKLAITNNFELHAVNKSVNYKRPYEEPDLLEEKILYMLSKKKAKEKKVFPTYKQLNLFDDG